MDEGKSVNDAVDFLYDQVKSKFRDLNSDSVVSLITHVMVLAEARGNLTGSEKKELVVLLVTRLVDEIEDSSTRTALQAAVKLLLPTMIDSIIAVSQGVFDLNKDGQVTSDEVATVCCRCLPC